MKPTLTDADKQRISDAVTAAEKNTSGEIVPVVVGASDTYPGARWRIAVSVAIATTTALLLLLPTVDPIFLMALQLPALGIGHLLATRPTLLRLALIRTKVDEETLQKAYELFVRLDLHHTRQRNGVLIMVSMLEHRVHILGDKGIYERLPREHWEGIVTTLCTQIRAGNLVGGLEEAVAACGESLAEHFPRAADDENELPNELVVES